jgi:hypothetical protein
LKLKIVFGSFGLNTDPNPDPKPAAGRIRKKFRIRNNEFGAHLFIYNMVGGVAKERPVVCVEEHFLRAGLANMCSFEKPQKQNGI